MNQGYKAERLMEIKDEMKDLLRETEQLVRGTPEEDRAHCYWQAHIRIALDNEHSYLGRGTCTMQDTIEALAGEGCEEDEADEDTFVSDPSDTTSDDRSQ